MNTPININKAEVWNKFKEYFLQEEDNYLFPAYALGYNAHFLSKIPDLGIPGQDPLIIVAAHLGRVHCEIEKENKRYMERCHEGEDYVSITKNPKTSVSESTARWYN